MTYQLSRTTHLPHPIEDVFEFFSNAQNLQSLTPPWVGFEVLSPLPIEMRPGQLIDYRIRVHGIPLKWRSEITAWEPPHRFVDEQRRGPYRSWHHEHRFHPTANGTEVTDLVSYDVFGGRLIQRLLVAPDLDKIFDYRQNKLLDLFPPAALPEPAP
ncbi:MAG: SRPBCC family protein [Thermoanaerobaculia bacterium]|nr:SRPBCC family protein [Thermoanaerobaculia bacterium]